MTPKLLSKLNKMFGDALGRAPVEYGDQPNYKWSQGKDLTFPMRVDRDFTKSNSGLWLPHNKYKVFSQLRDEEDQRRWMVALWKEPPSYDEWVRLYSTEIPYPTKGIYYVTSEMLRPGIEPTDEITQYLIGKIINHKGLTTTNFKNEMEEEQNCAERRKDELMDNILSDILPSHDAIPGKRGGCVTYGGI